VRHVAAEAVSASVRANRVQVSQNDSSRLSAEGCLQDEPAVHLTATAAPFASWFDLPITGGGNERPTEHGPAVEAGKTQPFNRTSCADQRT
jgi:hypothetical protein